mgnify:CR=1 FL=1
MGHICKKCKKNNNKEEKKRKKECIISHIMKQKKISVIEKEVLNLLLLPEGLQETNLEKLVIMSLKKQLKSKQNKKMTVNQLLSLNKFDCHNTNAIIQKKVLLIMAIEKKFDFQLTEENFDKCIEIQNLVEFSQIESKNGL